MRGLTIEFTNHLKIIERMFEKVGQLDYGSDPASYSLGKTAAFGYIKYRCAGTPLLNPKDFKTSTFKAGGIVRERFFTGADFGNYAYGVAARSMGIDPYTAIQGAGANALYSGSTTIRGIY